jgi:hypothetical protein
MIKKIGRIAAVALFLIAGVAKVSAQEVIMNSAETINKGNFKLALFPTVLLGKDGSESAWGLAGRIGYGLTRNFDIEAKGAAFQGLKYFGVDAEYWLYHGPQVNCSVALGAHMTDWGQGAGSSGIDTALLISTDPVRRLELYGGLMLSFDSIKNSDSRRTLAHVVPGIEYRLTDDLDFLAEVGIALNRNSRSYASVGLALYIR